MPIDVLDALKEVVSKQGNKTKDEAEQFVKILETKKRLQLETWS
jgi:sulfite reductase alpha subunit-like flavoprotein